MKGLELNNYRCSYCQKLLFKALLIQAIVEIKCKNCKNIVTVTQEVQKVKY